MLFSNKKSIACRSGRNVKCEKQINLLIIVDGEKRHYTAINSISRLLSKLNGKTKQAHHYCMNCLNGFHTESARDKHYEHKWLKFHNEQYQLKALFMLYADFESILRPVDERYRDKMNTMKAGHHILKR